MGLSVLTSPLGPGCEAASQIQMPGERWAQEATPSFSHRAKCDDRNSRRHRLRCRRALCLQGTSLQVTTEDGVDGGGDLGPVTWQ